MMWKNAQKYYQKNKFLTFHQFNSRGGRRVVARATTFLFWNFLFSLNKNVSFTFFDISFKRDLVKGFLTTEIDQKGNTW